MRSTYKLFRRVAGKRLGGSPREGATRAGHGGKLRREPLPGERISHGLRLLLSVRSKLLPSLAHRRANGEHARQDGRHDGEPLFVNRDLLLARCTTRHWPAKRAGLAF